MALVVLVALDGAIAVLCAMTANQRHRSPIAWFLLGLLFHVLALVAVLVLDDLEPWLRPQRR
jgi:hypothetical protein